MPYWSGWNISIHAPREGSDTERAEIGKTKAISIHAPREGSDCCATRCLGMGWKFLSTLPARGATERMCNA